MTDAFVCIYAVVIGIASARLQDALVVFAVFVAFAMAVRGALDAFFAVPRGFVRGAVFRRVLAGVAHAVRTDRGFVFQIARGAGLFIPHFRACFQHTFTVRRTFLRAVAIRILATFGFGVCAGPALFPVGCHTRVGFDLIGATFGRQLHIRASVRNANAVRHVITVGAGDALRRFTVVRNVRACRTFRGTGQTFARFRIQIHAVAAVFGFACAVFQIISAFTFRTDVGRCAFFASRAARIACAGKFVQILAVGTRFQHAFPVNQIIGGQTRDALRFRTFQTVRIQRAAFDAVVILGESSVGACYRFTFGFGRSRIRAGFVARAIFIRVAAAATAFAVGHFAVGTSACFARGTGDALLYAVLFSTFPPCAARRVRAGAVGFMPVFCGRTFGHARVIRTFFPIRIDTARTQLRALFDDRAVFVIFALGILFAQGRADAIGFPRSAADFFGDLFAGGKAVLHFAQLCAARDDKRVRIIQHGGGSPRRPTQNDKAKNKFSHEMPPKNIYYDSTVWHNFGC